jgi:hypothetical protein
MAMRINRATSPEIVDRNKQIVAAPLHKAAVLFRRPLFTVARVIANLRAVEEPQGRPLAGVGDVRRWSPGHTGILGSFVVD